MLGTRVANAEVGAIIDEVTNANNSGYDRDIIVQRTGDGVMRISDNHRMADPLTYPLLFPRGDRGWGLKTIELAKQTNKRKFVTAHQYLQYRIHQRGGDQDYHLLHGRLSQEWLINSFIKIEGARLDYLRHNQNKIKADQYKAVKKAKEQNRCT